MAQLQFQTMADLRGQPQEEAPLAPKLKYESMEQVREPTYDFGLIDRDKRIQQFVGDSGVTNEKVKSKLVSSVYFAEKFDIPFDKAYANYDGIVSHVYKKKMNPEEVLKGIQRSQKTNAELFEEYDNRYYKEAREQGKGRIQSGAISGWEKIKDRYNRMGVNMTKELVGLTEALGDITFSESLSSWSKGMREATDLYAQEHPEEFVDPAGKGFWDTTWNYVSNPEFILLGTMEQVPLMASSVGLGIVTGGTATAAGASAKAASWAKKIGAIQGFATPAFGRNYSNLRSLGVSPMGALPEAFLSAQAEGLLEEWTLGKKIQLFKGAGNVAKTGIANTSAKMLLGAGKTYSRGAFEEGTQQISNNFFEMMFRNTDVALLDDVGSSAAAGGLLEMTMAGAFSAGGKVVNYKSKAGKLESLDAIEEIIKNAPLNSEQRNEALSEVDAWRKQVSGEVEILGEQGVTVIGKDDIELTDLEGNPPKLNNDRTITLYHRTSEKNAQKIKETGEFESKEQGEVFFSTSEKGQANGYGDSIVSISIDPLKISLDDAFSGGEIHVSVSNKDISLKNLSQPIPQQQPIPKSQAEEIENTPIVGVEESKGGWQVKDYSTGEVIETKATEREAMESANNMNIPPIATMGGTSTETIDWIRASGETVKISRTELTNEMERLATDLEARIESNELATDEDVKQAEQDWLDIQSSRKSLGLNKETKPFKIVKSKDNKTIEIQRVKSRIWAAIKGEQKTVTVKQALEAVMKGKTTAAKAAYREAAKAIISMHKDIVKYAKAQLKGLPIGRVEMTRIMTAVANAKSETQKIDAISLVNAIKDNNAKAGAVKSLKKKIAWINRKMGKPRSENGIAPDYLEKIQEILNSFTTKETSAIKKKRIKGFANYLETIKRGEEATYDEKWTEYNLPAELISQVEKMELKSLEKMTLEEIKGINDIIGKLIHLNSTKNRLINERTGRRVAESLTEALEEAEQLEPRSDIEQRGEIDTQDRPDQNRGFWPDLKQGLKRVWDVVGGVENHNIETLAETLSSSKKGSIFEILATNISKGRQIQSEYLNKSSDIINKYTENMSIEEFQELSPAFFQWIKNPEMRKSLQKQGLNLSVTPRSYAFSVGNQKVNFTMSEMMSVYMATENLDTVNEMLRAGVADSYKKLGGITFKDIKRIRTKVEQNATAMKLIEMGKELKDYDAKRINETSRQLDGIDIADIVNYWHRERRGGGVRGHQEFRNSLLEAMGWLKKREGSGNPVVIRDFFSVLISDQAQISEYVGMAQPYRMVKNLLNYKAFRTTVETKGYGKELKNIDSLIERTEQRPTNSGIMDAIISKMTKGLIRSVLVNPGIMAGQVSSIIPIIQNEISGKYASAIDLRLQDDYVSRIKQYWYAGRRRLEGGVSSIALKELGDSDAALRTFKGKHDYLNFLMQGIHNMDSRAIVSIAKAVEAEMADGSMDGISREYWQWYDVDPSLLEKNSPEYWDAFNDRADYIVRRTQPMFHGEHKSMLTSDPSTLARSFAMFRSYVDQPIRMVHRNVTAYNNGTITGKELATRSATIWAGLATYEVIRALISKGMFGGDDDEIDLMLNIITAPTKVMAFIGFPAQKTLRELIDNKLTGDPIQLRYADLSPMPIQFANDIVRNTSDLTRALGYSGSKERFKSGKNRGKLKSKVYFDKAIYGITKNALRYNGIPAVQIDRILKNINEQD